MLTDRFSRKLDYLRVSVTDRCNLRCSYCVPPNGVDLLSHAEVLRNEEFVRFIEIFVRLGIRKVRFTGGEPLVRKGFIDIISGTRKALPDVELCLTTNGILLDEVLPDLKKYNIKKLNISLDTLSPGEYERITGRDYLTKVVSNIEKALSLSFFEIKINSVLHEDIIGGLESYFDFFKEKNVIIRFIEKMPFSLASSNKQQVSSSDLIAELEKMGRLIRTGKEDTKVALMYNYFFKDKFEIKIGIIPPMSHNFCSRCNRVRLTCDGYLRTCLLANHEYDLKTPYRMDMGEEAISKIILQAVTEKPESHKYEPGMSNEGCTALDSSRGMSKIGG